MRLTTELKQTIIESIQKEFQDEFFDKGCEDGDANMGFELGRYRIDIKGYFSNENYDMIDIDIADEFGGLVTVDYNTEEHSSFFQTVEAEITTCTGILIDDLIHA